MVAQKYVRQWVRHALAEDLGRRGDVTTRAMVPRSARGTAWIKTRQSIVCSGLPIVREVFRQIDSRSVVRLRAGDGAYLRTGTLLAEVRGSLRALLEGERVALNFLGRLSGIASLTRRYVERVRGTRAIILDTRKTTPGLRELEKYSVRMGGGKNHRMGLYDGILIKDNHIAAVGSISEAIRRARKKARGGGPIIVEAENHSEVREACEKGADIVLIDNLRGGRLRSAIDWIRKNHPRVKIEISGGVNLNNVRSLARLGVDRISVGALTHSAPFADLHMEIRPDVRR